MRKVIFLLIFSLFFCFSNGYSADKTFPNATDLSMQTLCFDTYTRSGATWIRAQQQYDFLKSDGSTHPSKGELIRVDVQFSTLPENIRTALTTIQTYMKNAALSQEGMD